jgi:hypothetical protein
VLLTPSEWDEGAIDAFLRTPTTNREGVAIDLPASKCVLVFYGTNADEDEHLARIAQTADGLLAWLGAPPSFLVALFWRDDRRVLAAPHEWPSKKTVNGGFTVPGSKEIAIYRSEEWDRVLLHEVIHAMHWDWRDMPSTPLPCWELGPRAVTFPHLFEAWTELYAEWLWATWYRVPWERQVAHMRSQAVEILARHHAAKAEAESWKEDTNVFAYYVLKVALEPFLPFLWVSGGPKNAEERTAVLCTAVTPALAELRRIAASTAPSRDPVSLRMSVGVCLRAAGGGA